MATGLLERDDELAQLQAAVDGLHRGEGAIVLVSGEAGVGKSSLVKAFLRTLDKRVRIRSGACEDLLSLRTLGPLRDAVRGQASPLAVALASGDQDAVFAPCTRSCPTRGSRPCSWWRTSTGPTTPRSTSCVSSAGASPP